MKTKRQVAAAAFCVYLAGLPATAQFVCRPWSQTTVPIAERVRADFKTLRHAEAFVHYDVPPMSGLQRLADVYPEDGVPGGTVTIVAAQDEYEPGSFLVYALRDLGKTQLSLTPFRKDDGTVFPAANLDLKVVKVWYQNRNAWYSYFGDTGFKLVPELLLNDEDLIRVDEKTGANYARLRFADGTVKERWINPPRQLDRAFWDFYRGGRAFSPMKPEFDDAETLQPVALPPGVFRNFFLTAHVTRAIPAGVYRGAVKVGTHGEIPVEIKVLDFILPKPKCYFDDDLDFYVNFYSYDCLGMIMEENGGDFELAKKQFLATMVNRVAHGQDINWLRFNLFGAESQACLRMMKEAGIRTDVIVASVPLATQGGTMTEIESAGRRGVAAADRLLGHHNVYAAFGDEPPAAWLKETRPVLRAAQQAGWKFILAGSDHVFRKAGYQYDWHNINKQAENDTTTKLWNQLGHSPHVAWYAKQHVGVENPEFNRRQNGMAAYLSNYSSLCNYAHHYGPYNDDVSGYRPMVFTYGVYSGVLDTIQWEGFREGVDDIRYATLLVKLAREAAKSASDIDMRYEGNKALQYLASFRKDADDLNACRFEMIKYILKLKDMLAKGDRP